jgi:hypothetical protein
MGSRWIVPVLAGLALAGCATQQAPQEPLAPAPAPEMPATIQPSEIVGRWGYTAYHRPEDKARTVAAARGLCTRPYVIGMGPTGGVLMTIADQTQAQELRLKGAPGGKNYIGPRGEPAGGSSDIEILEFDGRVLITRYVNPEVHSRYGFSAYVRCAPRA